VIAKTHNQRYTSPMSVLEIKQQIKSLSPDQIAEIRAFLDELESQAFDAQLETDSSSGKFDSLISKLEKQIDAGDWQPL
jgi:DNA-binding transcriptional MerR regulator